MEKKREGSLRLSFSLIKDDRRFNGVREVRHFHTKVNNVVGTDSIKSQKHFSNGNAENTIMI